MGSFYERRIVNADDIEIRHTLSDPLGGIVTPDDVELKLSNVDGFFNGTDMRGTAVDLTRFDREDAESVFEFSGTIMEQTINDDSVTVRLVSQDQDVLQTLIPRRTVTSSIFPLAHSEQGLGRTVPVVLGTVVSPYPLPYVTDNTSSNIYDYLVGEGSSYTAVSLYRDTAGDILSLVNSTEYSLNTTSYSGFTVARFPLRQVQFGGGLHTIYASVTGVQPEQNFGRAIRTVLTNSIWGLNQNNVDDTSFSSVESLSATVSSLACGGALLQSRPAVDVLNQLCMPQGMTLSKTNSNMWTLSIDQGSATATYQGRFGHGKGQHWNNVTEFGGLTRTPMRDAISKLHLDYAVDYRNNTYRNTVTRSVLSIGREKRIGNEFIQTGVTADKVVDYLSKRLIRGDQKASFTAGQEARNLKVGDLILYEAPQLSISSLGFKITEISRKLDTTRIAMEEWASSIYSYSEVSSIPPDITQPVEALWSVTTPTAPTSLLITGSGTVSDGQGGFSAFQVLHYNVTSEAYSQTYVRQRITTNSAWTTVAVNQTAGNSLSTRFDNLITGQTYALHVDRVNVLNPWLHAATEISSLRAPTDASGPTAPTSLAIVSQHLKNITFEWTASVDTDVQYYHWEVRTAASGGGTLVDEGNTEGPGTKVSLTLNQIAYSTTRYLRVLGHDWSNNDGAYSDSLSFSFSQIIAGDVGTDSIATVAVQDNAITDMGFSYTAGSTDVPDTEQQIELINVAADTLRGIVFLQGGFVSTIRTDTGSQDIFTEIRIRKDTITGTMLGYSAQQNPSQTSSMIACLSVGAIDVNPSSSQNYLLTARASVGSISVGYRYLSGLSTKR